MARLHLDIHKDDIVQVIHGKDRGKRGVVVRTVPQQTKIVVKGINILKRHQRALQQKAGTKVLQGGIVDFESPLDYSNVMLVCNKCDKPTRIRKTMLPNGRRAIVCVNCGEIYERVRTKV
jgi:large subunit ribosomal protein L24